MAKFTNMVRYECPECHMAMAFTPVGDDVVLKCLNCGYQCAKDAIKPDTAPEIGVA